MSYHQRIEVSATIGGFSPQEVEQLPSYFNSERQLKVPIPLSDQVTAAQMTFTVVGEQMGVSSEQVFRALKFDEACKNLLYHGNRGKAELLSHCQLTIEVKKDETRRHVSFVLALPDHSPTFDLETLPDPTADENLEVAKGRGIALMQDFGVNITQIPTQTGKVMVYAWTETEDLAPPSDAPSAEGSSAE